MTLFQSASAPSKPPSWPLWIVIAVFIAAVCGARFLIGCALLPAADDPEMQQLSASLAKCRAEGREAKAKGAAPNAAFSVYEECKRREHIEGPGAK